MSPQPPSSALNDAFLERGGELGALLRATDWSATPLGAVAGWPESLRSALGICLGSRFPIAIYWGEQLSLLYNDAWSPIPGNKHPWALGRGAQEVWPEIWTAIGPLFEQVMTTGESTYSEDSLLPMYRHGYTEECYFNFTFTPIRGADGSIGGVFNAVIETTFRVISERRAGVLRELSDRLAVAKSADDACATATAVLGAAGKDVSFCAVYLLDEAEQRARLAASIGLGGRGLPDEMPLAESALWPLAQARFARESQTVTGLAGRLGFAPPGGAWPEPATAAILTPIAASTVSGLAGFLLVGVSPRLGIDEHYRQFVEGAASHIGKVLATTSALEAERKRAEALAELDRAKTAFFSNVSHEFRTPLTLMLGPIEDLLATPGIEHREQLGVVHRNGQRLLKLVNTLLDFARIEAGRSQACFEPLDVAALTADLASNFRSACERAGLALEVDCPTLSEPAYIDREMWEKIVLNLLSNAFKFTFAGSISVACSETQDRIELTVRDTGTGIPEAELPLMFERFHRVEGAAGRSHEGSGIGLALVHDLVHLHGGSIRVESRLGLGSAFIVRIPKGAAHLPAAQVQTLQRRGVSTSVRAGAYVDEALGWLPKEEGTSLPPSPGGSPRVLLADDNADLRDYARRLLAEHYDVEAVADGEAALAAARASKPDLIVSDVMMPRLDGFGLIAALREDAELREIPVVLLSARAGEEARIEGLGKGADDYLVKPFSARELLVRIGALLRSADIRRETAMALREADRRKDEFIATLSHELRNPLAPLRNALQLLRLSGEASGPTAPVHQMMERQVDHLVRLVDDLLEMSRITRGAFDLRRERVDIASVVRNAVDTADPLIRAADHRLIISLPDEPLWVQGDPVRLAQILANLLNNSAKYTHSGGTIKLEAHRQGGMTVVSVSDNGIGIAPPQLGSVFDMFSRGESSTGLGIGLALARRLAEMHGATIDGVSAGLGQGSTFTLRIPIAAADLREETPSAAQPRPLAQKRVLVVDDNRDAADSLGMLLGFLGADVHVVHDGPGALAAFDEYAPGVVLLDIGMPEMDGYAVAREIRKRANGTRVALVALTGWGQESDRARARDAGFDHHLTKPADVGTLQALLAALPS